VDGSGQAVPRPEAHIAAANWPSPPAATAKGNRNIPDRGVPYHPSSWAETMKDDRANPKSPRIDGAAMG
jgi:hypothetical protein